MQPDNLVVTNNSSFKLELNGKDLICIDLITWASEKIVKKRKLVLKQKRNSEIWERSIQFYRNNQSNLTSYHILKIIKIAFKSIRSTITKNCRYLSKLAIRFSKRGDDLKMQEQIEDQKNALKKKVKVLLNLLDCYTLTIQAVLFSYDSSYFVISISYIEYDAST